MTRSLSRAAKPTRAAILRLVFTIFGIYLLSSSWRFPIGEDGRATLATSRSLLTHRTLAVDAGFASDEGFGPRAIVGVDGRAYAKAGLGLPIAELPFVATGLLMSKLAGLPEAQTLASVLSLLNPLVSACTVIVVYRLCQTIGGSPLAICFLFLAWLNWFRFGSALEMGYEPHAFMNHFSDGIYGLIFSFNKGIVFYAPPLVLVPVGLWIMRRTQRGEAMLIAGAS